jgi:hypothetical protein
MFGQHMVTLLPQESLCNHPPPPSFCVAGLVYNTYNWEDRDDYKLFDAKHEILTEIVLFVDKAIRSIFWTPFLTLLPLQ